VRAFVPASSLHLYRATLTKAIRDNLTIAELFCSILSAEDHPRGFTLGQ
jgi:hypothetical protein